MSRDARKKEKQRLKRKQKQKQARKAAAVTALDRVARGAGQLECYVNDDWRESGMASIQVLGQLPDGRCAHSGFLVDVWCVGLKDAFGNRNSLRAEFDDHLDYMGEMLHMVRVPPAEAKRLVAGAIRFSRQNGFKLPPHYDRWVTILGDLGELSHADLTDFGVDGGLRYVGDEDFLRRRLAACSLEEFLDREDVEWVMAADVPLELVDSLDRDGEEEEDEGEDFDEDGDEGFSLDGLDLSEVPAFSELARALGDTSERAERAVLDWCRSSGVAPHPRLREALNTLLASVIPAAMYAEQAVDNPEMVDPAELPDPDEMLDISLDTYPAGERRQIEDAMVQVEQFMKQFNSPAAMLASLEGPPGGAAATPA